MEAFLQQFQHLKIQLEEIISATNNFHKENFIGGGGFGKVYKGELSHPKGCIMVAIKRLDRKHGQGTPEFLKEIMSLSRYKHENLISLLGFCFERSEMILVYEYASHGSLGRYLNSPHLTWSQRLKICLNAANGLSYLHDPRGAHQRLIHCDVKSGNILLDEEWNAKVSDFGLSIMGPANEQQSVIVTLAAGTQGYIDPLYWMTNTLTKESDVYSFGVVLFEVLSGALCCTYSNGRFQQNLVPIWIESYKEKKLNANIFKSPNIQPLHPSALETFLDISYRCLKESREDRPKMAEVVIELEAVLAIQELSEGKFPSFIYEDTTTTRNFTFTSKLWELLCEGILLNGGKTWFSLNKKGEHCEMISIAECLGSDVPSSRFSSKYNSRFAVGSYAYFFTNENVKITHVKTQFLSPGITYTVNLVFKFQNREYKGCEPILLKYKLQEDKESSISYLACEREDGWWMCELYQFTCDHKIVHLQILFEGFDKLAILEVEGIEFQPLETVEHIDEKQPISDSDANWEEKNPTDYEDIIKRSENSVQWTTKEEAYSIMSKGFFISIDEIKERIWFSIDKNWKKRHMRSATLILPTILNKKIFLPESRFGEAAEWTSEYISIYTEVQSQLLSFETTYACYLVYKLPEDQSRFEGPLKVEDYSKCDSGDKIWYIYLTCPQTPVIRPKAGQSTHNPLNRPKIKGISQQRNDGWIEVQIWEPQATTTMNMHLLLRFPDDKSLNGLIIEGIEFRPI